MPLPKIHRVVQDSLGNVVPQVLCSVLLEGTGTLATLWQDDAGTIPLSNPMTSDATYGSFDFYVQPAHYDLTFTKPGYVFQPLLDMQVPQDDLTLGTLAQQDAHDVTITGGSIALTETLEVGGQTALYQSLGVGGLAPVGTGHVQVAGTVGLGGKLVDTSITLGILHTKASRFGLIFSAFGTDIGNQGVVFQNMAGTFVGTIDYNATVTSYNTTSDARLKTAVEPLRGALEVVRSLKPITHRWKVDDSPGVGLLADEVQAVIPAGVVSGDKDAVDDEGQIVPQMIDYSKLVPWLVSACQDLAQQVEALTARLETAGR